MQSALLEIIDPVKYLEQRAEGVKWILIMLPAPTQLRLETSAELRTPHAYYHKET